MKRVELFEFTDFQGLPSFIHSGVTKLLNVLHRMNKTSGVLKKIILEGQQKTDFTQIIDLGAGSGGPMIDVVQEINKKKSTTHPISLLLTDKFPNPTTVRQINNSQIPHVRYSSEVLDVMELEKAPKGLKTMICSFHHMGPRVAKHILNTAEKNKEPILIYELAENNIPFFLWCLLLPLSLLILIIMSLVMTLFVKNLSITQIVFTYFIPVIPIVYAWDGQASLMRTYTFEDIKSLLGERMNKGYHWEIASAKKSNGKKAGYYVLGYPV